jgi:hypothetical protein
MGQEATRSPGQPLDEAMRREMGVRFGHDFSQVRVHTDAKAVASARAVQALAYTLGRDIVFDEGQYSPRTARGQRLLVHELTHVVQQQASSSEAGDAPAVESAAEREADSVSQSFATPVQMRAPVRIGHHARGLYRQQTPGAAPQSGQSGMTRADFEQTMKRRLGVSRIATGTMQEQASRLTPRGGGPPGGLTLPNWRRWDPGVTSPVYHSIIEGFEDFASAIGGVPSVQEVLFFDVAYEVNQAGVAVPQPNVGASFGAGHLTIYRGLTAENKALPIGRSHPQGNYPPVVIGVTGIPGQSPGAPLPLPSRDQSMRRLIGHELGHGLAEAALGPNPAQALDPTMMVDFQREVGWTIGPPAQLFDVGVSAVSTALAAGTPPPANYEITPRNWNSPNWREQPLSHYSVEGGPAEDFAEAVMTFVQEPNLLLSRSPRRFHFIDGRKDRWLPRLMQLPQIGDFPESRGDTYVV